MHRLSPLLLLSGLALAASACGGAATAKPTVRHAADGITYRLPTGLHAATRSLTPHLTAPREVLSVGSAMLPAGGDCAQFPSAALQAMGPRDVLVTLQEREGHESGFPIRPKRFAVPPNAHLSEAQLCAGEHPAFTSSWFGFRDAGRNFHVLLAVGRSASTARVRSVLAVLDSLRIAPRGHRAGVTFDDPKRGLRLVHPADWHGYPTALTQAITARDGVALGTFELHQDKPDPNCSPVTAQRARGASGGLLYLFEYEGVNRRQLARFPKRPTHLRLPRHSANFECFGTSRAVLFQDGGRAFQAHVYGPPGRRREALAILDSLRVRPAPFDTHAHAARFPASSRWHTRISEPSHESACLRQRVSWGSTVAFSDGARSLPPHTMLASLPADGIIIAAVQYLDSCRRLQGVHALRPPLQLAGAHRTQFPGPRGDELPLYRLDGRFAGRYDLDVWVFYGRPHPTATQRAEAQRELAGVRWPAWL